jgi:hypothetical protein
VTIPQTSLEEVVSIVGPDDEQLFLEFVRKMLQWHLSKENSPRNSSKTHGSLERQEEVLNNRDVSLKAD